MIPEEYFEQQERELAIARQQASTNNIQQNAMAMQLGEDSTNLIKEQLSLENEIESIKYLLQGYTLESDDEGIQRWTKPKDKEMVVLTTYGVELIMNAILFYLNKNTLLSNYDEPTIFQKMEDFSTSLVDSVFMEYEKVFQYPTLEECKEVLDQRLKRKVDTKIFSLKIKGENFDEKLERKITQQFLSELDIENELEKIKQQIIKNKLKRFDLLMRVVQDSVHSTYLRALNGQERRTLRQHITVSENVSPQLFKQPIKQSKGIFRR